MEIKSVKMLDDDGNVIASKVIEEKTPEPTPEPIPEPTPEPANEPSPEPTPEPVKLELKEEDVLSFVKEKKNIQINSLDELSDMLNKPKTELDAEVETYLKYKQDTGRSLEDFLKLNKDFSTEDPNKLIKDFYKDQDPSLTERELEHKVKKFTYDEDFDDEDSVIEKKLALREELTKATKHFEDLKEKYKTPLESRKDLSSEFDEDTLKAYKEYLSSLPEVEQEQKRKADFFVEQTNNLFSDKFEGFKFEVDGKSVVYKPAEAATLKESQANINNFLSRFVDDKGYLKDAETFHRAIAIASDVDKFYKFAYDQAKADAVLELERQSKNIDMGMKPATTVTSTGGIKMRVVDDGSNERYVIKSRT
jgi:hypothetical protein